jgi:hypothetical protein
MLRGDRACVLDQLPSQHLGPIDGSTASGRHYELRAMVRSGAARPRARHAQSPLGMMRATRPGVGRDARHSKFPNRARALAHRLRKTSAMCSCPRAAKRSAADGRASAEARLADGAWLTWTAVTVRRAGRVLMALARARVGIANMRRWTCGREIARTRASVGVEGETRGARRRLTDAGTACGVANFAVAARTAAVGRAHGQACRTIAALFRL